MEEEFHRIRLRDREWIEPLLSVDRELAADNCFGTYYLWGDAFGLRVSRQGDRLLAYCGIGERISFFYPHGSGDVEEAVKAMAERAREHGANLVIQGVTSLEKKELEQAMPGYFLFEEKRGRSDYIYETSQLAALSGKKYHGKKNHCNRFEKEWPDWHSEMLTKDHASECIGLLSAWQDSHGEGADEMQLAEQTAVIKSFQYYQELGMEGIALYVGKRMAGFSFGERIGHMGFDVHFEKADTEIHGAYAMVNREMARMLAERHPEMKYLNREEDMGLENLRKAKESYHPVFRIDKYSACRSLDKDHPATFLGPQNCTAGE